LQEACDIDIWLAPLEKETKETFCQIDDALAIAIRVVDEISEAQGEIILE